MMTQDEEPMEQVECPEKPQSEEPQVAGTSHDENVENPVEMEDGELPEDGEIMDDEDDEPEPPKPNVPAASGSVPGNRSTPYAKNQTNAGQTNGHIDEANTEGQNAVNQSENDKRRGSPLNDVRARNEGASPDRLFGQSVPQLPPRRRQPWTETVLCKFFREGFCRDGDTCAYSHNAAHSNRKPELCKFYQQGFCKKGLACTLLHGEYPCKAFHEGMCDKNPCKYSHVPLNDYTRTIFDQMVQDEALASKIHIPQNAPRRRVLLPRPAPVPIQPEPVAVRSSPAHEREREREPDRERERERETPAYDFMDSPYNPANDRASTAVKEPFVAQTASEDPDEALVAEDDYMRHVPAVPPYNRNAGSKSTESSNFEASVVPSYTEDMSLSDMFDQIAQAPMPAAPKNPIILTDSLSSTESKPAPVNTSPLPSKSTTKKESVYRLILQADTAPEYDVAFMKKISSPRFKDDPRIRSMVEKQFEQNSNMFMQNMPALQKPANQKEKPRDPRTRTAPSDPRVRKEPSKAAAANPVPPNVSPSSFNNATPAVSDMDLDRLQSLAAQQMMMVNQQLSVQEDADPHSMPPMDYGQYNSRPFNGGPPPARRDFERNFPDDRYNEGAYYNDGRYDDSYGAYDDHDPHYRNGGSQRYPAGAPPPSSRGRGRGYYEGERNFRSGGGGRHERVDARDARWENRGESYRREPYHREPRERREYPGARSASTRYGRERSRSRSPRRADPPVEERPMSLREKRKNNEYQSPLARA